MAKIKVRRNLLEDQSYLDRLVDPSEAYLDPITNQPWLPIGGTPAGSDELIAPFRNETELKYIRQRARITSHRNPYAKNFINSMVAFTVGKGHQYNVVACESYQQDDNVTPLIRRVQVWLKRLLKKNVWTQRQKEIVKRYHRDGEVFIRVFPQDNGFTYFRFVEPMQVTTPSKYSGKDHCSYGIECEEDDIETVLSYFIDDDEVDAAEIQHRKANVDMTTKRGLSSFYIIQDNLERATKLLRNMSQTVQTQSAIAVIRKHNKSAAKVQSFADSQKSYSTPNPFTGKTDRFRQIKPGAVLDVKQGDVEYEFPAAGLDPAAPVAVLSAELRAIASSKSLPEYMIGSDASNANYSSTMVAESPAVRAFEDEQSTMIEADLELIDFALDNAIACGVLPPEVRSMIEIEVVGPVLVTRDPLANAQTDEIYDRIGVKSKQSISSGLGLKYDQEQSNRQEYQDTYGDLDPSQQVPGGFGG